MTPTLMRTVKQAPQVALLLLLGACSSERELREPRRAPPPPAVAGEEPAPATPAPEEPASDAVAEEDARPLTVSLELEDADVKVVLWLIAQQADANIVFPADIQGRVSLSFRDVPWREALEAVAGTAGLVVVSDDPPVLEKRSVDP